MQSQNANCTYWYVICIVSNAICLKYASEGWHRIAIAMISATFIEYLQENHKLDTY